MQRDVGERDDMLLRRGGDGISPAHGAGDVVQWRQHAAEPIVDGRLSRRARRGAGGRGEPRTKLNGEAMCEADARRRGVNDAGLGGKLPVVYAAMVLATRS